MTNQQWIEKAAKYMLDIKFFDLYDQAYDYAEGLACDYYENGFGMDPEDAVMEDLSYYD